MTEQLRFFRQVRVEEDLKLAYLMSAVDSAFVPWTLYMESPPEYEIDSRLNCVDNRITFTVSSPQGFRDLLALEEKIKAQATEDASWGDADADEVKNIVDHIFRFLWDQYHTQYEIGTEVYLVEYETSFPFSSKHGSERS